MTVLNLQVNASGCDQGNPGGTWSTTHINWQVGTLSCNTVIQAAARFVCVSGLCGVTVNSATFQLWSRANDLGSPNTTVYAEDAAAPTIPTSICDFNGRTKTTAGVDWDVFTGGACAWGTLCIKSVIQELADTHNSTTIVILHADRCSPVDCSNDYLRFRTYDYCSCKAPKLCIAHSIPFIPKIVVI